MITLLTRKDLSQLDAERLHPHIALYLKDYFSHMLTQFNCDNLAQYGGIMLLESTEDVELFNGMNMRSSMIYDSAVRHILDENTDLVQIIYNYYGKAIIIFAVPEIAEPIIENEYHLAQSKEKIVC